MAAAVTLHIVGQGEEHDAKLMAGRGSYLHRRTTSGVRGVALRADGSIQLTPMAIFSLSGFSVVPII